MQWFLQQHSLELGDEANVKTAAMLAKQMAYQNKVSRTTFLQMFPHQLWPRQHRFKAQLVIPLTPARIMVFRRCYLSAVPAVKVNAVPDCLLPLPYRTCCKQG